MTNIAIRMQTTPDENEARSVMISWNRARHGKTNMAVMVEGPEEGEFTVMDLRDAVDGGFFYSWAV